MAFSLVFILCLVTSAAAQTTQNNPVCGDTSYYGPSGIILSPNYPGNYDNMIDCYYNVYGSAESVLTFIFSSFHVETFDFVAIGCATNSSFLPRNYSGHLLPSPLSIRWCSQALVNFRTDASVVSTGFSLDYYVSQDGCGQTVYTFENGFVNSPNWPSYYKYKQSCQNIVWAEEQSTFHLNFHNFDIESCSSCDCDWLEIRCLHDSESGSERYCGNRDNHMLYVYQCNQVLLWFNSDVTNNYPGFHIEYNVYPVGGCGATSYYGPSGIISSPNYPGNYDNMLDCYYNIYGSAESVFTFMHNSFHVETFDFLTIGCATNSSFVPRNYSGHLLPNPISIRWCSQAVVNFRTDASVVSTGFSLDYYVSQDGCGQTAYIGPNGFVRSPGWPSHYGYNKTCVNTIWVAEKSTFHLNFQNFDLENCSSCDCDWLEIRCLDNLESGPQRYCSNHDNHMMYVYRCSEVLLWFHSDVTNNYPGFNIEYNVYPDGGCGATSYYGPSGIISSPNYPGEYYAYIDCNFDVHASAESSISFIFKAFSTEVCCDVVTISCPTNSSFPPQIYSGQSLPDPVSVPWCSQGRVNFHSDYSTAYSGFSLDYFVSVRGCGNTLYGGSHGYVTSPSYPSYYGNDQNCSNIIWAEQPSHFHLQFLYIDVPFCGTCICDWVEISCLDNNPSYNPRFCGDIESSLDFYQCTQVLVWFHSDSSNVYPGFNLEYNIYNDSGSTASPSTTTASTTTAIVPQNCGDTYYGPSGVISSPNYPGNYANDLSCDYYVTASSSSSSIAVIFKEFDTQECCDYVTISCPTNSIYPSVRYSGSTLPQPLSIPWCSKAAVNFVTDSSIVSTGFSLDYHVSLGGCGDTVYTGSTGHVSSPDYPSNYGINQNCSNIIWARLSSSFSITFLYMNIEECCDFVELSCLDNVEFGTHRFTGTTIPPKQTIPQCTQVLVWFYSDDTVVQEGFSLEYFAA